LNPVLTKAHEKKRSSTGREEIRRKDLCRRENRCSRSVRERIQETRNISEGRPRREKKCVRGAGKRKGPESIGSEGSCQERQSRAPRPKANTGPWRGSCKARLNQKGPPKRTQKKNWGGGGGGHRVNLQLPCRPVSRGGFKKVSRRGNCRATLRGSLNV